MDPALIALWAGAILVIAVAIFWTPASGGDSPNDGRYGEVESDDGGHGRH